MSSDTKSSTSTSDLKPTSTTDTSSTTTSGTSTLPAFPPPRSNRYLDPNHFLNLKEQNAAKVQARLDQMHAHDKKYHGIEPPPKGTNNGTKDRGDAESFGTGKVSSLGNMVKGAFSALN